MASMVNTESERSQKIISNNLSGQNRCAKEEKAKYMCSMPILSINRTQAGRFPKVKTNQTWSIMKNQLHWHYYQSLLLFYSPSYIEYKTSSLLVLSLNKMVKKGY